MKACIFDLDGVIVDTVKYHFLSWQKLAKELGFQIPELVREKTKGISRPASLDIILDYHHNFDYGQEIKQKLLIRKNELYLKLIKNIDQREVFHGVKELIIDLKENDIKIALGSASKNARQTLINLKIESWFDVIFDGNDVIKSKPDPEVFLLGSNYLGLHPTECLVIEDSYKGLQAANKGGFKSLGVGDPNILSNTQNVVKNLKNQNYLSLLNIYVSQIKQLDSKSHIFKSIVT